MIDEADSDRERTMTAEGVIDFGDDPRHPAMGIPVLPQFEDKYRSPVQFEEFFQTPRKARWNKKVRVWTGGAWRGKVVAMRIGGRHWGLILCCHDARSDSVGTIS